MAATSRLDRALERNINEVVRAQYYFEVLLKLEGAKPKVETADASDKQQLNFLRLAYLAFYEGMITHAVMPKFNRQRPQPVDLTHVTRNPCGAECYGQLSKALLPKSFQASVVLKAAV